MVTDRISRVLPLYSKCGYSTVYAAALRVSLEEIHVIQIYRCVCFDQTFSELKRVAEDASVDTVQDLQKHIEFGLNCGLCLPYVRRMLTTGQSVFSEVIEEVADEGADEGKEEGKEEGNEPN